MKGRRSAALFCNYTVHVCAVSRPQIMHAAHMRPDARKQQQAGAAFPATRRGEAKPPCTSDMRAPPAIRLLVCTSFRRHEAGKTGGAHSPPYNATTPPSTVHMRAASRLPLLFTRPLPSLLAYSWHSCNSARAACQQDKQRWWL